MRFSVPSLLGLSFLSVLTSTSLAASISKRFIASSVSNKAIDEITQLYSFYSLTLDDKNYTDLSYVFTKDVIFNLPTYSISTLPVVEESYRAQYLNKTTLHTLENVFVYANSTTVNTVASDGIVIYFGQGNLTGQTVTFYSRFRDILVKENGSWKISIRTLVRQIIIGNHAISDVR